MKQPCFGFLMRSRFVFNITLLRLFLKYLLFDIKSIGSLRSARINEFDVRGICYLGSNGTHVESGIENARD